MTYSFSRLAGTVSDADKDDSSQCLDSDASKGGAPDAH